MFHYKSPIPKKVPFIIGAAVMMFKSLYDEIGGLEENYFFYNDDIDLCKTLQRKGYEIHYIPTVSVTHYLGLATKTRSIPSIIEGYRGSTFYCRKFYPYPIFFIYRILLIILLLIQILFQAPFALWRDSNRSVMMAYINVIIILMKNQLEAQR